MLDSVFVSRNGFPTGWDEKRVRAALEHCEAQTEAQTEEEAVAEDEAAYE